MDEIEYKLNTNTSVLVVNAIDKLITTIKSKYNPGERQKFVLENEELKFLREKCSSKDTLVSLTACQGLLALVELGVLEIGHTMSTVVTLLPSAHNYSAIISTMAGLLTLDLKSRLVPGQPYVCPFNLRSPQHPLVTVLERSPAAVDDVISQMRALCNHPDYIIASNSLELLRPVFVWLACDVSGRGARAWPLLLALPESAAREKLLVSCLGYQQMSSPELVERALAAYSAVAEAALYTQRIDHIGALLPLLATLSTNMVHQGRDPRGCYAVLERCFALDLPELRPSAGLVVALLADNLTHSSALHLHELFNLVLNIISKYECSSISLNTFAALTLQWLSLPSYLTTNSLKVASKIVDSYQDYTKEDNRYHMPNLKSNKTFETLLYTDRHLSVVFKLHETWERIRDNPDKLRSWFENIESVDSQLQLELMPFLVGIMMEKRKEDWFEEFVLRALDILTGLVDVKKETAVQLLPILLFKLANSKSPNIKMECLNALPLMAKTKENVPTVVSLLNKLKVKKGVPASFLIKLYTRLAESQVRCFPYLQELLVDPAIGRPDDLKWETDIARAMAVKRICQIRPTTHGLELVSVISGVLNKCTDAGGALAAAAALGALAALWRAAAVAPAGAWRALEGRLGRDTRPRVHVSICRLLSEVPSLRVQTPEYDRLLSDTARRLWSYVAEANQPEVVEAACDALGGYRVDDYKLKDIPGIYRKTVKLPPAYCKTPVDAARNPEDVLDYIPCEVWPEVYRYTNQAALGAVERLFSRLIGREVRAYRSGVYQVEARAEPPSAGYLPAASVVRGLLDCFRKQATTPSYDFPDAVLLSILRTLTREYPKPLPPVDLCFLHEVFHRGSLWRQSCVKLAARQAQTSGSARRFVDNYLQGVAGDGCEESDVDLVFELLPILCRGMPPNSLRPVLDKCLGESYDVIANVKSKQPFDPAEVIKELRKQKDLKKEQKVLEKDQKVLQKDQKVLETEEKVLKKEHEDSKRDSEELSSKYKFIKQLEMIREALDCDKIHDANRTLLSQFVENYFGVIRDDNVSYPAYVTTCSRLPTEYLERVTAPTSWWEVTSHALRAACAVRALRASETGSLVWLNEVVDACAGHVTEQEFSLRCVMPALQAAEPAGRATADWFLQLMARTQLAFNEHDRTEEESSKQYLCDVLMMAAVVFAGHWALEPDVASRPARHALFPAAIAALVGSDAYKTCALQMLEWLVHTRDRTGDGALRRCCQRALLAAQHAEPFAEHKLWRRLESHYGKDTCAGGG